MRLAINSWRCMLGLLASAFIFIAAAPGASADEFGPRVGSRAPDIGTRLDQDGKPRTFADLVGRAGLLLMFNRSAGWCPYCQAQMVQVNGGLADIEKRGFRIVALSYDAPNVLKAFAEKRRIGYTLLSDPKSEVIDAYGLRDPQYQPGHRAHGVPRPITLILDRNATILAKLYEENFRVRPPIEAIIGKLDEVGPRG